MQTYLFNVHPFKCKELVDSEQKSEAGRGRSFLNTFSLG